jgi:hypothetical protein
VGSCYIYRKVPGWMDGISLYWKPYCALCESAGQHPQPQGLVISDVLLELLFKVASIMWNLPSRLNLNL